MTPERWRQIEDVFQEALDLASPERELFIEEKCAGDSELIAEVRKLIARYEAEDSFLESPVWTDSQFLQSQVKREIADSLDDVLPGRKDSSFIGEQIGVYRLTEELGRGGMGIVFLAERADGEFQQKVAVKLIKRGMDTDFIVSRFRHERQILANLNHPNTARLLDGGTTADGSPYFIMEYIEGEPINKFCESRNYDLRRKLELFLQACAAIAYAHKRKIIHRDIKPSNILVTADGVPKLLDFGIAKILDPDTIHESVSPTATAMRLMTPEYASPEQVRGEEITPASDQYSLGVLLYELITGARPYKFPSRAPHEIARVICEQIPSEPSSGEFGKIISNTQFSLDPDFCKKLDRIVLKTLRKTPSERYASVEEFAADINRFLRNENILADSLPNEEKITFPPAPLAKESRVTLVDVKETNRTNDMVAPQHIKAQNEKTVSPRGKGVRQGLFLVILSFLSIPILTAAILLTEIPPILQFFVFVILFFAGVIRVVYALILEPERKQTIASASLTNDAARHPASDSQLSAKSVRQSDEIKVQRSEAETLVEKKSIAVLPFKNLNRFSGEDSSSEFLNVGLADALISRLSGIHSFAVRPTSSVLRFAGEESDSFAAGSELNVKFVLEGSIIRTGKRIRVSVQLLNVAEKSTIWAERFDEDFTDVLSLEDSISARVAESLLPHLSTVEAQNLAKRATDNAAAYEAFLRGRAAWNTFSESGLREAIGFYQKAIELDPLYAQAHAAIADYHIWLGIYGGMSPDQTYPAAKAAARRAIELDGQLAEAYAALGLAQIYSDFDWQAGEENMLHALELNPNNSTAHLWRAHPLLARRQFDEAIKHVERSIELDPTSFPAQIMLAYAYYFARRYDDAISTGSEILENFPEYSYAFLSQSSFLRTVGRFDEAINCALRALVLSGDSLFVTIIYAQTLAAAGKKIEAEKVLSEAETKTADKFFSYYLTSIVHCYLKEKDKAFVALEKAVDKRDGLLIWVGNEPSFDFLRDDARYQSLLEKINHPLSTSGKSEHYSLRQTRTTFTKTETDVESLNSSARRLPSALKYIAVAVAALVLGYGLYNIISHTTFDSSSTPPARQWKNTFASTMKIKRLTASGKARQAALSPDGKNVAYLSDDAARQSLWLRPVNGEEARLLVAPDEVFYTDLRFSPDGNYVYYIVSRLPDRTLYRVSVSGTTPEKISENILNLFALSPDGRRLVYDHQNSDNRQNSLFIAELDEKSQIKSAQTLFNLDSPNYFPGSISFSPDGGKIVYPRTTIEKNKEVINLFVYDLQTKTNEKLGARDFNRINSAAWRANGEEIIISASENESAPHQLWVVAYPSGEISRLTNDFTDYLGVSLSSDSSGLVTTKINEISNIWTSELAASNQSFESKTKQITSGIDRLDGRNGVNWTKDGQILYSGGVGTERSIMLMNRDGANSRAILTGATNPSFPSLTGDNRQLVFADKKGQELNIWRFDMTTNSLAQISSGYGVTPTLSPDNRTVVYSALLEDSSNRLSIHRKLIDGGEETVLTNALSVRPVVSPDGRFIACNYVGDETNNSWQIAILPFDGSGAPRFIKPYANKFFRSPQERPLAWSPDGKFLYFLNNANNITNIFRVAATGDSPPIQMTHFTAGELFDFALAPGGQTAVIARGSISSDVIIFKDNSE